MSAELEEEVDADELPSVQEMYRMMQNLQNTVQQQQERIEELEAELEAQPDLEARGDTGKPDEIWIGNHPIGMMTQKAREQSKEALAKIESREDALDEAADIRQDLVNEQKARSRADGTLERQIQTLADEVDVDLKDADVAGEDKIVRLMKYGPDDITDRVYPVHERARDVLAHAGEWGNKAQDAYGARIGLRATRVRKHLESHRNENLQSKQVRDVFEKIVELAEDSPRKVRMEKSHDGVNQLILYLTDEEVEA